MDGYDCYGAMSHPTLWWMCQHNLQRAQCNRCFFDRELDLLVFGRFFKSGGSAHHKRDRERMDDIHPHEHGVAHYNSTAKRGKRDKRDDDNGHAEHKSDGNRPPLHPVLRKSISGIFYAHNPDAISIPDYGGYLADNDTDDGALEL